jgi:hypothetical protein
MEAQANARPPVPSMESTTQSAIRNPRRRFIGRRTADAQAKRNADANVQLEETTAMVQKGELCSLLLENRIR